MENKLDAGRLLRETRTRQGLSQRSLAVRAGTSQDAISRIERGVEAPTLDRLAQLMLAMGQRPVIAVEPLESSTPADELMVSAAMTQAERLREAVSWNRVASSLSASGERARREGHPATRRQAR
jgi:transcriptional regulator with XRE-family HTH domain